MSLTSEHGLTGRSSVTTKTSVTTGSRASRAPNLGGTDGGRVIGLPSQVNGLWAIRDENVEAPVPAPKQSHTDKGFLAMSELTTLRQLNEDLQKRLGILEAAKFEAISSQAEAVGRAVSAEGDLQRARSEHQACLQQLQRELADAHRVASEKEAQLAMWPSRLSSAEAAVQAERSEVQRAVHHARTAGRAADDALAALSVERAGRAEAERRLREAEARAAAADSLAAECEELRAKVAALEEDVETEKEWREAAQRERAEACARSEQLQRHAEAAGAVADRVESQKGSLQAELLKLRRQAEEAEAERQKADAARKEAAKKRARDGAAASSAAKDSEKARVAALELEVERLRSAVEDLPKLQQALRREKAARLAAEAAAAGPAGGSVGPPHQGRAVSPIVSGVRSPRSAAGREGGAAAPGGPKRGTLSIPLPQGGPAGSAAARAESAARPALKRTSPQPTQKSSTNSAKPHAHASAPTAGVAGKKLQSGDPGASSKKQQSVGRGFNLDDFDDDDDDDAEDPRFGRGFPGDFDDGGGGGDDDDDQGERFFLREAVRGPRAAPQQVRAVKAAQPLQRALKDAALLEGTDLPDWLRDD